MFCKVCGLNIEDSVKSCPNCGAAVENISYSQPTYLAEAVVQKVDTAHNGIAVAALVLGIVSISFGIICCIPYVTAILSFICGVVGLVLGIFALKSKKKTQAIVGLSLSAVAIVVSIIVVIFWTVFFINVNNHKNISQEDDIFQYQYSQAEKNG